jgi:hypothetical protein
MYLSLQTKKFFYDPSQRMHFFVKYQSLFKKLIDMAFVSKNRIELQWKQPYLYVFSTENGGNLWVYLFEEPPFYLEKTK